MPQNLPRRIEKAHQFMMTGPTHTKHKLSLFTLCTVRLGNLHSIQKQGLPPMQKTMQIHSLVMERL